MRDLLVMVLLITAFVLGVVYGPWVRERVQHIQPPQILSDWGKGVTRKSKACFGRAARRIHGEFTGDHSLSRRVAHCSGQTWP